MMRLLARFHRWRLATTIYWLPYERQLHSALLTDDRLSPMREMLADQITALFEATRSQNIAELAATYSYRCSKFFDVTDDFTLCRIHAVNAEGVIRFGGGMLAEIRLSPTVAVVNPIKFQLEGIALDQIQIPHVVASPKSTGWVGEFETGGLIRRSGPPRDTVRTQADSPALRQYRELFAQCSEAEFLFQSESFPFLPPNDASNMNSRRDDREFPILDLRELGGLSITASNDGDVAVSLVENGKIAWTEPDLVTAIKRLQSVLGK